MAAASTSSAHHAGTRDVEILDRRFDGQAFLSGGRTINRAIRCLRVTGERGGRAFLPICDVLSQTGDDFFRRSDHRISKLVLALRIARRLAIPLNEIRFGQKFQQCNGGVSGRSKMKIQFRWDIDSDIVQYGDRCDIWDDVQAQKYDKSRGGGFK